ncbi:hypothetical protein L3Q82_000225 [Scortum barcoo]|uniref:Uncharacterized protein n=1 Tax=Scortum barcoo TaxID=214431 RepID=A0ACB8X9K8_9TELE|nr:hypothetical protein L3Q82_000225 [Scortum barcoo]
MKLAKLPKDRGITILSLSLGRSTLGKGTGEENSADKSSPLGFRRNNAVFIVRSWNTGPALYPPQGA